MKYEQLKEHIEEAWEAFFDVLEERCGDDIDEDKLEKMLDRKDIFYPVRCAVAECTDIESEDE